jgi:hypothetical protein
MSIEAEMRLNKEQLSYLCGYSLCCMSALGAKAYEGLNNKNWELLCRIFT